MGTLVLDSVLRGLACSVVAVMLLVCSFAIVGGVIGCAVAPPAVCCPSDCPDCTCPGCEPCPDGVCPPQSSIGIMTEAEHFALPSNNYRLNELKFQDCWNCPPSYIVPTYLPSPTKPFTPATVRPPAAKRDPLTETKTGTYSCTRCKEGKVGTLFHTSWTDEGRPVTYLCRECWEKCTPAERVAHFERWYGPQPVDPSTEAAMRSAVVSDL